MNWHGKRYYSFDSFLKNYFGEKIYKVSLDGGFTCPNRDGTLGTLFYKDALIFDQLKSRTVALKHKESGHGILVTFPDFDYLGVWSSANDGPFVALEPWSGTSTCSDEDDVFEHKRGVRFLEPGEHETLSFVIEIL